MGNCIGWTVDPKTKVNPYLNELQVRALHEWIDTLPLTRLPMNYDQDFCDGCLIAEILFTYFPSLVELQEYEPSNRKFSKYRNLYFLNEKVLSHIGFTIPEEDVHSMLDCERGRAEKVLYALMVMLREADSRKLSTDSPSEDNIKTPAIISLRDYSREQTFRQNGYAGEEQSRSPALTRWKKQRNEELGERSGVLEYSKWSPKESVAYSEHSQASIDQSAHGPNATTKWNRKGGYSEKRESLELNSLNVTLTGGRQTRSLLRDMIDDRSMKEKRCLGPVAMAVDEDEEIDLDDSIGSRGYGRQRQCSFAGYSSPAPNNPSAMFGYYSPADELSQQSHKAIAPHSSSAAKGPAPLMKKRVSFQGFPLVEPEYHILMPSEAEDSTPPELKVGTNIGLSERRSSLQDMIRRKKGEALTRENSGRSLL